MQDCQCADRTQQSSAHHIVTEGMFDPSENDNCLFGCTQEVFVAVQTKPRRINAAEASKRQ